MGATHARFPFFFPRAPHCFFLGRFTFWKRKRVDDTNRSLQTTSRKCTSELGTWPLPSPSPRERNSLCLGMMLPSLLSLCSTLLLSEVSGLLFEKAAGLWGLVWWQRLLSKGPTHPLYCIKISSHVALKFDWFIACREKNGAAKYINGNHMVSASSVCTVNMKQRLSPFCLLLILRLFLSCVGYKVL